jgi:hypothetical protein
MNATSPSSPFFSRWTPFLSAFLCLLHLLAVAVIVFLLYCFGRHSLRFAPRIRANKRKNKTKQQYHIYKAKQRMGRLLPHLRGEARKRKTEGSTRRPRKGSPPSTSFFSLVCVFVLPPPLRDGCAVIAAFTLRSPVFFLFVLALRAVICSPCLPARVKVVYAPVRWVSGAPDPPPFPSLVTSSLRRGRSAFLCLTLVSLFLFLSATTFSSLGVVARHAHCTSLSFLFLVPTQEDRLNAVDKTRTRGCFFFLRRKSTSPFPSPPFFHSLPPCLFFNIAALCTLPSLDV